MTWPPARPLVFERLYEADDAADILYAGWPVAFVKQVRDHGSVTITGKQFQQQTAVDLLIDEVDAFDLRLDRQRCLAQKAFQVIARVRPLQQRLAVGGRQGRGLLFAVARTFMDVNQLVGPERARDFPGQFLGR